jgi:hypothetical protein
MGSQLPPVPDGIDLSDDKRPNIMVGSIFTYALAVIGVALRVAGRKIKGLNLGLDDWLAIASLVTKAHEKQMIGNTLTDAL